MGFVDSSTVPAMPVFYNVVYAVGAGCPNFADDVLLVQYLLKLYYDRQNPAAKPKGDMELDGLCGPVTLNWIQAFQLDCNRYNNEIVVIVDTRMNRIVNRNLIGSMTGKYYSLALLNYNVMTSNPVAWANTPYVIPMSYRNQVPDPGVYDVARFKAIPQGV